MEIYKLFEYLLQLWWIHHPYSLNYSLNVTEIHGFANNFMFINEFEGIVRPNE